MRVQTTSVAITLLTFPFTIYGAVEMRSGSFQQTAVDSGVISRIYNSRSLHSGVFGFGWCSNIEINYDTDCPEPSNSLKHTIDGQGRVASLKFLDGTVWKIHYNKESKVKQVSSPRLDIKYEYQDDNLVQAGSEKYAYDTLHNLVSVVRGNKSEEVIYDPDRDWVLEYKRADGCVEKFSYERTNPLSGPKETATAQVRCGPKIDLVTYEFFYQRDMDGVKLAKVRSTAGDLVKIITLERGS
jgi:hypothetical protein